MKIYRLIIIVIIIIYYYCCLYYGVLFYVAVTQFSLASLILVLLASRLVLKVFQVVYW
jgi:hypothetical protein